MVNSVFQIYLTYEWETSFTVQMVYCLSLVSGNCWVLSCCSANQKKGPGDNTGEAKGGGRNWWSYFMKPIAWDNCTPLRQALHQDMNRILSLALFWTILGYEDVLGEGREKRLLQKCVGVTIKINESKFKYEERWVKLSKSCYIY